MLATEYPYNGNDKLIRFYSDAGFTIRQVETGNEYGEAIDRYPSRYTYEETDNPIEPEEYPVELEVDTTGNSLNSDHVTLINGKPFDYKED